ncbi:MAG: YihY/virulence factor BrkB family protein [Dehalococcoidia bacterium]
MQDISFYYGLLRRRIGAAIRASGPAAQVGRGLKFLVVLLSRSVREFSEDDATHMAAGVAYFALFSLFPLLLGLIAILGQVIDEETLSDQLTDWASRYLPGTGEFVADNIDTAIRQRASLGVLSILGLVWSGSAVFGAITRAVNRAWDIHEDRPFYIAKARQLAMALGVGVLFLLSISAATLAQAADSLRGEDIAVLSQVQESIGLFLFRGISFLFTLAIFLAIYKFTPNTRTYWRYIWSGAVLAALLFEISKTLFIVYLERVASFSQVYGSIGSVIAVLLWAYLSSLILFFGAEVSSEYGRMRRGIKRGTLIHSGEDPPLPQNPGQAGDG